MYFDVIEAVSLMTKEMDIFYAPSAEIEKGDLIIGVENDDDIFRVLRTCVVSENDVFDMIVSLACKEPQKVKMKLRKVHINYESEDLKW